MWRTSSENHLTGLTGYRLLLKKMEQDSGAFGGFALAIVAVE